MAYKTYKSDTANKTLKTYSISESSVAVKKKLKVKFTLAVKDL